MNAISTMPLGIRFEKDFFGPQARLYKRVSRRLPFDKALKYVRENQKQLGWNTKAPSTEHSMMLFQQVKKCLSTHHREQLQLFVSVGTSLDSWGIDAFFQISETAYVTFDISLKSSHPRADVLITPRDLDENFQTVAPKIADLLTKRALNMRNGYQNECPRNRTNFSHH